MSSLAPPPAAGSNPAILFKCARCGIESPERTCFVIPERYSKPPRDTRCVTCEGQRVRPSHARGITVAVFSIVWPLFLLAGAQRGSQHLQMASIILAAVFYPLAVVLHELGHALTGLCLGLEVGAITIGFGPTLAQFQLGGLPVRFHTGLLSGRVYFGSASRRLLRTRLWIATLLGPATNAALVALAVHCWGTVESSIGSNALMLWVIVNSMLVGIAIVPYRSTEFGQAYRSDGLALLEIPRTPDSKLTIYLSASPLMRAWYRYEVRDYAAAKMSAAEALARAPESAVARVILAASLINLEDYAEAAALMEPAVAATPRTEPGARAMVCNALAVAVLIQNAHPPKQAELVRSEELSREAFTSYPCVLEYRATRALTLTAVGCPEQALALLEYRHYDTGTEQQRGHRACARAFALRALARDAEADEEAALSVVLDPRNAELLKRLGVTRVLAPE
jgi:hypothetical protein